MIFRRRVNMGLSIVVGSLGLACGGAEAETDDTTQTSADSGVSITASASATTGTAGTDTKGSTSAGPTTEGATSTTGDDVPEVKYDVGSMPDLGGCNEVEITPMAVTPNILLVLDYSSSMQNNLNGASRWSVLWDALTFLINGWDDRLNLGAMTFPDVDINANNSCITEDVEVPVAPLGGQNIIATIPGPGVDPPGNTPTRASVLVAANHLETLDPAVPRAIFLVTDGDALCGPDQWEELTDDGVDEVIGEIFTNRGIPTYVIGLAATGGAFTDHLDEMALAGGAPNPAPDYNYYPGNDLMQLSAVFEQVAGDVIGCTLTLESPPSDPNNFKVQVDGVDYTYVESCAEGDGWTFVPDTDNKELALCGAACLAFKQGKTFSAKQYCPGG
jgi:hypothetical protein